MGKKNVKFSVKGGSKQKKQSFKFKGKHRKGNFFKRRVNTFDTNARLVIRNLSFKTTEESLKGHFEPFGKIVSVTLLKRPNGDLVGCGFIQYEDLENAKHALASTNSRPFLGRSIQVDWAVPKNEFVANTKENKTTESKEESEVVKSEAESDGEAPVQNDKNKDKKTKRNQEERQPAKHIPKQEVKLESENDSKKNLNKSKDVKKARLIVRNISFKATEASLKEHFMPHGEVMETTLLRKPNGDLVGCGFVQFANVQSATKAILKTNAQPFLGRPIHVDWAVAKNKYMSYVTQKKDEEEYLKYEVKSEPESDDDTKDIKVKVDADTSIKKESDSEEDESQEESGDSDDDDEGEENGDDDDDEDNHDDKSQEQDPSKLKVSANDAEDGKTVFLKNVPFSIGNEELEEYISHFGETQYSLVCMDKLTEHSKGTAFVRFKNKEDADIFLSAGPERLTIDGQLLEVLPAMFRDRINGKNSKTKKQPKDSRNLYLVKEGVIIANSKAAIGVSASDMAKRLSLEQSKSMMLRNLNRFISRYRLTIHNIPQHYTDEDLRKLCLQMANVKPYCLKECRIMKHLKGPLGPNGKHMSKGYGFVMFTKHEDALACLRRLNNNPSVFDKNNRPIVSFSVEDKAMINARKKRLEKSITKNPMSKSYIPQDSEKKSDNVRNNRRNNRNQFTDNKRKRTNEDETDLNKNTKNNKKRRKNDQKNQNEKQNVQNKKQGKETNNESEYLQYSGESAKPGQVRMRSRFKLKNEAMLHKENVKKEKLKKKFANRTQNIQLKQKVKQPKQKQNTNISKKKIKMFNTQKDDKHFSDLVNKYKSKLLPGNSTVKIKSKWYEQS